MSKGMQKREKICRDYDVTALYVFGSRAAEMLRALEDDSYPFEPSASDFDIGILTQSTFSIENKVSLTLELERIFDTARVDLFVLQEVDAFLAANIIRGERVYAADSYIADEYELFVLRRAGDLAELERERIAMILQEG
jgi:predicted nucleotidyltransferase